MNKIRHTQGNDFVNTTKETWCKNGPARIGQYSKQLITNSRNVCSSNQFQKDHIYRI